MNTPSNGVAVVTGGANGIGNATAVLLASEGYTVLILDTDERRGLRLEKKHELITLRSADVLDEAGVAQIFEQQVPELGQLKLLVNCAGVGGAIGSVLNVGTAEFQKTLNILTVGTLIPQKYAGRLFREQGCGGAIVNVGSIASDMVGIAPVAYSSAKSALRSLTIHAAIELASDNVRVNAVAPGPVATRMLGLRHHHDELQAVVMRHQPLKKPLEPVEVARVIQFLGSDNASAITGAIVPVDGGLSVAGSAYWGDQATTLGIDNATGFHHGDGLELDSSLSSS